MSVSAESFLLNSPCSLIIYIYIRSFILRMAAEIATKRKELEEHYKKLMDAQMESMTDDAPPSRTKNWSLRFFDLKRGVYQKLLPIGLPSKTSWRPMSSAPKRIRRWIIWPPGPGHSCTHTSWNSCAVCIYAIIWYHPLYTWCRTIKNPKAAEAKAKSSTRKSKAKEDKKSKEKEKEDATEEETSKKKKKTKKRIKEEQEDAEEPPKKKKSKKWYGIYGSTLTLYMLQLFGNSFVSEFHFGNYA